MKPSYFGDTAKGPSSEDEYENDNPAIPTTSATQNSPFYSYHIKQSEIDVI